MAVITKKQTGQGKRDANFGNKADMRLVPSLKSNIYGVVTSQLQCANVIKKSISADRKGISKWLWKGNARRATSRSRLVSEREVETRSRRERRVFLLQNLKQSLRVSALLAGCDDRFVLIVALSNGYDSGLMQTALVATQVRFVNKVDSGWWWFDV